MNVKLNDNITLARRKNSTLWQAVMKTPEGKWRRISTKKDNKEEAATFAYELYSEWRLMKKLGLGNTGVKKFKQVAEKYIEQLKLGKENNTINVSQRSYAGILQKYLIPHFGDHRIDKIDSSLVKSFDKFRKITLGRTPAKGTINIHNIVLRATLEYAVHQKWMKATDIPKLTIKGKGISAKRRGYFTVDEFNALMKFMATWAKKGNYITKYKRDMLMLYVYFMCSTGVRAGNEALGIKLKHFEYVNAGADKENYYRLHIMEGKKQYDTSDEKQSTRTVVVSEGCYNYVTALMFEKNPNELLFCMPDGSALTGMSEIFRNCLTLAGLRYSTGGEVRTLYSCRHTYATWKLQQGKVGYEQLSCQMGTSASMLEKHYNHAVAESFSEHLIL